MAHAAFGLINSTPHSSLLPPEEMRGLLRDDGAAVAQLTSEDNLAGRNLV